jgi:hypothetical protein
MEDKDKYPAFTATGELAQPARLYYEVLDIKRTVRFLSRRRSITYDARRNRYSWYFTGDARHVDLPRKYTDFSHLKRSPRIGFLHIVNSCMHADFDSFERALAFIEFIQEYIPVTVLRLKKIAYRNIFLEYTTQLDGKHDLLFLYVEYTGKNTEHSEVVSLSNFYEEGIDSLRRLLAEKQLMAMNRWNVNEDETLVDVMTKCFFNRSVSNQLSMILPREEQSQ